MSSSQFLIVADQAGLASEPLGVRARMCDGTYQNYWECSCEFSSDDTSVADVDLYCTHRGTGIDTGETFFRDVARDVPGPRCGEQTLYTSCSVAVEPSVGSISPARGLVGTTINVTITGRGFRAGQTTVNAGAGIAVSNVMVNSSTQLTADFAFDVNATGGNRNVTITVRGRTGRQSVTFFVQIPSRLVRTFTGPLQTPVDGDVVSYTGVVLARNQCGVYRNYAYVLVDQQGQRIFQPFRIDEVFQCSECPFGQPTADPADIPAGLEVPDIQVLTFPYPRCIRSGERERFLISFAVTVGQRRFDLSTIVSSERGSISEQLRVDSEIIVP